MADNTHTYNDALDDLFDDIRQTCSDCEHPRCLSIIKSAKQRLQSETDRKAVTDSDLAWCIGKLRGLGYPAKYLEEKYGVKAQKDTTYSGKPIPEPNPTKEFRKD